MSCNDRCAFVQLGSATGQHKPAGRMKGGRHIRFQQATPLANLHLTLLDKVGVRLDSFADSQGKVDELFEPLSL